MQSQARNYLLFFLSFILIIAGYSWVRNRFWPPPPQLSAQGRIDAELASRMLAGSIPTGTLGDAGRLYYGARVTHEDERNSLIAELDEKAKKDKAAAEAAAHTKPAQPAKPAELISLGGDDFNLAVTLTNRGAGVRELTLTKFKAADWYGRPAKDDKGQPLSLQMIPPSDATSFAIYHYATADDKEKQPLDTLGKRDWQIVEKKTDGDNQRVVFATDLPEYGARLIKTFTLQPKEYHLGLTVRVERMTGAATTTPLRYQLVGVAPGELPEELKVNDPERVKLSNKRPVPIEGGWYTSLFRNALFNWVDADNSDKRIVFDSRTLGTTAGSDRVPRTGPRLQYAAVSNQYFTSAIVVAEDQPKQDFVAFVRATVEGVLDKTKPQFDDITVRAIADPVEPKDGEPVEHKYILYHGPVKVRLLEQLGGEGGISAELAHRYETTLHLNTLTDYGGFGIWTNAIVFFTNVVHWLISALRHVSPNDALCIILVTVLVRLAMMPVSRRQAASMARQQEAMAKVQPEVKKLNERYKNDLVAKQQAQMELYRKHGINPAASLGGCLMLFLQMPIFLGLYYALQESFFFRLESFLWIRNLTAPDMLIWWTEKIPFISELSSLGSFFYLGPYFNLLPVLALTLMFIQMKWMQPPPADEQVAQQQKMTQYIMIPMFAFLFYKMPAGLCLYFISTTLWGLAERKWLPKKKVKPEATVSVNGKPGSRGKAKGQAVPPPGKLRAWWDNLLKEASKK
jgi:YidC/Oxa1 family membrane protein insertase